MKLKGIKTARVLDRKIKPVFKLTNNNTIMKISKSPRSRNNFSEMEKKENTNLQNFQTSIASIDSSISFNESNKNYEECNGNTFYKKYLISRSQYNQKISEIVDINNKYMQNKTEIEKLEKYLEKLKQEKKEKESYIIDLLSQKESLEEIYNLKLFSLYKKTKNDNNKDINGQMKENIKDIKNKGNMKNGKIKNKPNININGIDNANDELEINRFETINIINDDEVEIQLDDIKKSNPEKYEEQVINLAEEFLQKKDMEINNKLIEKIKFGYQIFFLETNSYTCIKLDNIISNFFSRASSIISKESNGKFTEKLINSFLKILLKLNIVNDEMSKTSKFLNKIYKNAKKQIKEKITILNKRNANLNNKKVSYEKMKNELKKFIDENKDKIKNNENNVIHIENDNKQQYMSFMVDNHIENDNKQQYMSFMVDNRIENDFELLNDEKRYNGCETERLSNDKMELEYSAISLDKNNPKAKSLNAKKLSMNKVINVRNKLNEAHNGVKNVNNVIINYIPYNNKNKKLYENNEQNIDKNNKEIKVNNLLINNNINIENNNNIINNINGNNNKEKITNLKNSPENKSILITKGVKINSLKKIAIPHKSNANICHSPTNLKRNLIKNKLFAIDKKENPCKNLTPSKSIICNEKKKALDTSVNKSFNNIYNITEDIPESLCFFKLSDKNEFNPLTDSSPFRFNYFEGSIFLDKIFNKLKVCRKTEKKFIGIDLKDILEIRLGKEMDNVIKIYNSYKKRKKNKNEKIDFNKLVNSEEMKTIRMQQNVKNKLVNIKFFNFSIIVGKRFIPKAEFIFENVDNFIIWYNCLDYIAKTNNLDKDKKKLF